MTVHDNRIYLEHILDCVTLIQDYTRNGKAAFMGSALVQDAVLRRLQTMAESTQRLSDDLKRQAPEVDWRALSGFRNVLVHDYLGGIDLAAGLGCGSALPARVRSCGIDAGHIVTVQAHIIAGIPEPRL